MELKLAFRDTEPTELSNQETVRISHERASRAGLASARTSGMGINEAYTGAIKHLR